MRAGIIAGAVIALVAVPASAQTLGPYTSRDNTPQATATTTIVSTDGNSRTLTVPATSVVGGIVEQGGGNIVTAQTSVTTTATLVAAARATRQRVTFSVGAANTCAFGNSGVTTTTGFPLQPTVGATLTIQTTAAIYAVCSATTTISVLDQYR